LFNPSVSTIYSLPQPEGIKLSLDAISASREQLQFQVRPTGGLAMRKYAISLLAVALLFAIGAMAAGAEKPVTVKGWVSDTMCAAKGDKKCANKDHLKQGAKLALVTDGDNKIWTVENPDKLADHQGHYVQVKGVENAEAATIKVETASALPEPKE
jgi:hypothetical protein